MRPVHRIRFALIAFLLASSGGLVHGETPAIREVSLFKNGLGYFVHEGVLPSGGGELVIEGPVEASHGSWWIDYDPRSVRMKSIKAVSRSASDRRPVTSVADAVRAAVGRSVRVQIGETWFAGRILSIASDTSVMKRNGREPAMPFPAEELVEFLAEDGTHYFPIHAIQRIAAAEALPRDYTVESRRSAVEILSEAVGASPYRLSYLRDGVAWLPSYRFDVTEAETGVIRLQAVVVNDAVDLDKVRLNFVSGFPNLAFAHAKSALDVDRSIDEILSSLDRGGASFRRESVLMNQAVYAEAADPRRRADFSGTGYGDAEAGGYAEDLFFYPIENVTLAKGQRGSFDVVSGEVPTKHVYLWRIPREELPQNEYQRGYQGGEAARKLDDVWHVARFTNPFRLPLTTAPIMTVSEGRLLGQDVLGYTAPGAEAEIRISKAGEIKVEREEIEVERKRGASQFHGNSYDAVTVEGTLSIRNFKGEGVALEIEKIFEGALVEASGKPATSVIAEGLKRINETTRLKWAVDISAGESISLSYRYTVFIRG